VEVGKGLLGRVCMCSHGCVRVYGSVIDVSVAFISVVAGMYVGIKLESNLFLTNADLCSVVIYNFVQQCL
jgi:hypothetical protein